MDADAERNSDRQGHLAGDRQRDDELHHPGAGRGERLRLDATDRHHNRVLERNVVIRNALRGDGRRHRQLLCRRRFVRQQFHWRVVHPSFDLPLDIDGCAGDPPVGVGLAEGLHPRPLQRPAAGLCDDARHGYDVGLDELRPLHQLVRHGLGQPEPDAIRCCCAHTLLLRSEKHLGARLPVGWTRVLLPDVDQPCQCE
jgi:hypothetical protein